MRLTEFPDPQVPQQVPMVAQEPQSDSSHGAWVDYPKKSIVGPTELMVDQHHLSARARTAKSWLQYAIETLDSIFSSCLPCSHLVSGQSIIPLHHLAWWHVITRRQVKSPEALTESVLVGFEKQLTSVCLSPDGSGVPAGHLHKLCMRADMQFFLVFLFVYRSHADCAR